MSYLWTIDSKIMKFIFTTDWHLISKVPSKRTNLILEGQFEKVKKILEEAKNEKVDFILHGGDFFDEYNPDVWLILRILSLLKDNSIPFYVIPGNHDLYGNNVLSLDRCGLSVLEMANVLKIFTKPFKIEDITFVPILHGTFSLSFLKEGEIIVAHELIVPQPTMFEHILCKDIDLFYNKLFLCGDYHIPFKYEGKSLFLNPGCLVRKSISEKDFNPGFYIIEYNGKVTNFQYKNVPAINDFLIDEIEKNFSGVNFDSIEVSFDDSLVDIKKLIKEIGLSMKIKREALERLLMEVDKYV